MPHPHLPPELLDHIVDCLHDSEDALRACCLVSKPWISRTRKHLFAQITIRTVSYPLIWKHLLHSGVTHYCGAPTVQIGLVNAPEARELGRPVVAIIAGSAPTAHLLGELEKRHFRPVHVYGLT